MYQQSSSTTSTLPYSNGHLSPPSTKPGINEPTSPDSESDLSEPVDLPNAPASYPASERYEAAGDSRMQDSDAESSHDEDAMGSDDPDYDIATPPHANTTSSRDARSSSQDSPRQRKRKIGTEPDEYILKDPELYGLRRSVSLCLPKLHQPTNPEIQGPPSSITTDCMYNYARKRRTIT